MAGIAKSIQLLRERLLLARPAAIAEAFSTRLGGATAFGLDSQRACSGDAEPAEAAPASGKAAWEGTQYRHQDSFEFVAASVRKCLTHLGPWTIGDLAFGIMALADTHKARAYEFEGAPLRDAKLLQQFLEEVRIADAIYEPTVEKVTRLCSLREADIVRFVAEADRMRPAYCIALRPDARQVVLAVRGTKSLGDAITILTGSGADFQGGHTHAGMLHSAHWLLHHETANLAQLLCDHPGYSLRFIGHSLGAGATSLYAMLLREEAARGNVSFPGGILPTCLAVAAPACTTQDLANSCSGYVTSLVCQNDVVPRACLWGFEQLRQQVKETAWQDNLAEKLVGEMANAGERYKAVAGVLSKGDARKGDARTAKAFDVLGEAWQSLSQNAAKHSDTARELLSKTLLSVSKLPVRSAMSEKLAADPSKLQLGVGRKLWQMYNRSNEQEGGAGLKDGEADGPRQASVEVLGLAADGDIDAELAELLTHAGEDDSADRARAGVVPAPRMLPPGDIIFLRRISGTPEEGEYEASQGIASEQFSHIRLSKSMITDHLCTTYMAALQSVLGRLKAEA